MHTATLLFLVAPIFIRPALAQPPDSYSYQILYTGRTLGYARIPDQQTLPPSAGAPSPVAEEFLKQFALAAESATGLQIRIAMGDNFSPDLYGRSIQVQPGTTAPSCDGVPNGTYSSDIHLPKDYFTFVANQGWFTWCQLPTAPPVSRAPFTDNVADFLIKA